MTFPTYPPELEQRLMVGLTRAPGDGRLRTEPQRGPAFERGGSDALPETVQAYTILPIAHAERFWSFYRETLGRGVGRFIIRDQRLDGLPLLDESYEPILDENGLQIPDTSNWTAKFGALPSETSLGGGQWKLSFPLEIF